MWTGSWRNGVYDYHHYHSNTHEVLGCYRGSAEVQLGGPGGIVLRIETGDVVVIPAGVAHKRVDAEGGFGVVGAYPNGLSPDMCYGKSEELTFAEGNIEAVPLPAKDPADPVKNILLTLWSR
jgi:uncharacterized protein YjlB